jgi:hypothetical protein
LGFEISQRPFISLCLLVLEKGWLGTSIPKDFMAIRTQKFSLQLSQDPFKVKEI